MGPATAAHTPQNLQTARDGRYLEHAALIDCMEAKVDTTAVVMEKTDVAPPIISRE